MRHPSLSLTRSPAQRDSAEPCQEERPVPASVSHSEYRPLPSRWTAGTAERSRGGPLRRVVEMTVNGWLSVQYDETRVLHGVARVQTQPVDTGRESIPTDRQCVFSSCVARFSQ